MASLVDLWMFEVEMSIVHGYMKSTLREELISLKVDFSDSTNAH